MEEDSKGEIEPLIPGSATRHVMVEGHPCGGGEWSPCRGSTKSVDGKKKCNLYECPYHPLDIADHFG